MQCTYYHVGREIPNTSLSVQGNQLNPCRKKIIIIIIKKEVNCVPCHFPVTFISNSCNSQIKRWVQFLSATAVAVRTHQEASSCSLTPGSPATMQSLAAAVSWPLSVMDETTECSLLFHSYINTVLPCWQARRTWFWQRAKQIRTQRHKGSRYEE